MPRPRKSRKICSRPCCTSFVPQHGFGQPITMSLDEYEVIRLIDLEALNQGQCAEQMGIARTTAQAIYAEARKKLAQCIVNGRPLHIAGGDVHLCEQRAGARGQECCKQLKGSANCRMEEK